MKPIPAEIKILYDAALVKKGVPLPDHFYYRKWLRYYFDFCSKYQHQKSKKESLLHFLQKLKDKNQSKQQRKQAHHTVSIFREIKNTDQDKIKVFENKKENISTKKTELKSTNANWRPVYNDLASEIKLRHYSQRILEAYMRWIRQFQGA
jgi:hypothetical protein